MSGVVSGPRTLDQLEGSLTADGVTLPDDVLDRIDATPAPGVTLEVVDAMGVFGPRSLDAARRRR